MDIKMAVENTAVDDPTERFALVSDANAILLRELDQHSMFTELLPDPSRVWVSEWFQTCMNVMVCALERLDVGEDAVKARKMWNSSMGNSYTTIFAYCSSKLFNNPQRSTIFIRKSELKPLKGYELDTDVAFKVTPLLNAIEISISEYPKPENRKEKAAYDKVSSLLAILKTHLDGMILRKWHTAWHYCFKQWCDMLIAHLEDCVEVVQHNDINKQHTNRKIGTFIADGRVVEELPISIEAQRLLHDVCVWWCSKLNDWQMTQLDDGQQIAVSQPELGGFYNKRDELSLLKLTELYCAIQEYNEDWAFALC